MILFQQTSTVLAEFFSPRSLICSNFPPQPAAPTLPFAGCWPEEGERDAWLVCRCDRHGGGTRRVFVKHQTASQRRWRLPWTAWARVKSRGSLSAVIVYCFAGH